MSKYLIRPSNTSANDHEKMRIENVSEASLVLATIGDRRGSKLVKNGVCQCAGKSAAGAGLPL